MLELKTFGGLSLEADGAHLGGAATRPKGLALLALLAPRDQGMSRDQVIACLWPDTDTARGRHLLKQACHDLRRELGQPELFLGRKVLQLNPAVIASDVQRFEAALEQGDHARAVASYAGPFLDGFYLDGNAEFERWVDALRERLARRAGGALETLARGATAHGDHAAAAEWWRHLTELDPLSSEATLGRMTALAAAKERAAALVVGREYAELVRRELDAAPARAVATLMEQLRKQSAEPVVAPPSLVLPSGSAGPDVADAGPASAAPRIRTRSISGRRRGLIAAGGLAAVAVVVATMVATGPDPRTVIAVGTIHDYVGSGEALPGSAVAELLATNLARVPELQVISTTRLHEIGRAMAARGDSLTVMSRAARGAGATDLVEGALFRRSDGAFRLQLQIVDVRTGVVRRALVDEDRDPIALVDRLSAQLIEGFAPPRH